MRVLFLGDVVGNCGRDAVVETVPDLRRQLNLDYVVVNAENISGGRGTTPKHAEQLFAAGVDVITGGNHTFQHSEFYPVLDRDPRVLRPINFPKGVPGKGMTTVGRLTIINAIGRTFMAQEVADPFRAVDEALELAPKGNFILVDFHGEATSEKQAIGWYLDGRVTGVVGTHTHVPTADARLLPKGTAFCTDAGMCGARDSIIGDHVDAVLRRFLTQLPTRLGPAEGTAQLNGLLIEAEDRDGRAISIVRSDHIIEV